MVTIAKLNGSILIVSRYQRYLKGCGTAQTVERIDQFVKRNWTNALSLNNFTKIIIVNTTIQACNSHCLKLTSILYYNYNESHLD